MTISLRADRAVFRFSGADAHKLLNDVVTGYVPAGGNEAAAWALLSPQGKILAEGLAGFAEDAIWVDVHQSVADDFFKRMKMYRLRAQVVIDDLRETHRVGFAQHKELAGIQHHDRKGSVQLGWRVIAPLEAAMDWLQDDTSYQAARIEAGIAHQGNDFLANDTFAHDIGFDILDGIDFDKGCYVGQEVVSRMKHRGTARRRVVIVSAQTAVPAVGTELMAGGKPIGTLGTVSGSKGLAIVRIDRVADAIASGTDIMADDVAVTVALPAWSGLSFPSADPAANAEA